MACHSISFSAVPEKLLEVSNYLSALIRNMLSSDAQAVVFVSVTVVFVNHQRYVNLC